jgi:type II secretory pathway pseudopilin PulG
MKKIVAMAIIVSLAAFLLFSSGGCSKIGERIAESISEEAIESAIEEGIEGEGGQADVDISTGEVTISTDESQTSWGPSTELPDNFPSAVPLYPNMTPRAKTNWQEDGKDYFIIDFDTDDEGEGIYNWYLDNFPAKGWNVDFNSKTEAGDGNASYYVSANDGTYSVAVIVSVYNEVTTVSVDVGYMD